MDIKDSRLKQLQMQRMIKLVLQVFQETTMDRRIEVIVENRVVRLLETGNHEVADRGKTPIYRAVENVVRRAVVRGAVNEAIRVKVDNLADSKDFV